MDKFFDQVSKIIEEAAKSPLGLLALMIMALSILALLFFRDVSPRIRVGIFLVVFLGFLPLGAAIYQVILPSANGPVNMRPLKSGTVVKLERLPAVPKDAADLGEWHDTWLLEFFNAQIIIDQGSPQGTKQGDYFVVIQEEKEIKSNDGKILGVLQEEGSLVQVVDARPNFSICNLSALSSESYSKALEVRLTKVADKDGHIDLEKYPELLAPVTVGQKVIAIPQEEKALWNQIDKAYARTLAAHTGDEEKKFHYTDMIGKADAFMLEYGNGYFAPDALFQKGFAQYQLQQYSESINTFGLFLKRYPFHPLARGAERWIEKARKVMKKERGTTR
jgi:hypothetical protein